MLSSTGSFHKVNLVKQQFYVKEFYIINIIFGVGLCTTFISGIFRMIVARKKCINYVSIYWLAYGSKVWGCQEVTSTVTVLNKMSDGRKFLYLETVFWIRASFMREAVSSCDLNVGFRTKRNLLSITHWQYYSISKTFGSVSHI